MKGVLALPGAFIPGTGITLKLGEIRGVKSEAMMLSAREMGLGDDHSGIVDLPEDAPLGESYVKYAGMDDPVIEISVTPNRGDALSVHGVARDLAAAGPRPAEAAGAAGRSPPPIPRRCTGRSPTRAPATTCSAAPSAACGTAPRPPGCSDWLVAIGLRPINALVDVTNLFTYRPRPAAACLRRGQGAGHAR